MNSLLIRIKQSKLLSSLLIFGFVISILLISIGISFVTNLIYAQKAKDNNSPPNAEVYSISYSKINNAHNQVMYNLFSNINNDTGLFINYLMFHVDGADVNSYSQCSGEIFTDDKVWHIPLAKGNYYSSSDIAKGNKVILIGSSLEKYTYKKGKDILIKVEGDEYRVVGVIGFSNQSSEWDQRMAMPCTSLPQKYLKKNLKKDRDPITFVIYNSNGDYSQSIKKVTSNGKKYFDNFALDDLGPITSKSVLNLVASNMDKLILVAIIGYIITILFAINITAFWIDKRRYEISVRKAFGFTNGSIMKMIFKEMIGFAIISFMIAIIIQFVLSVVVGSIANYTLQLYLPNLAIGLVVVLVTALITTLIPAIKAIRVEPAEALKARMG